MTPQFEALSRRLVPWLEPKLAQLESARRAGTLGHAWLISGPAGVGKINLALVMAARLLGDDARGGELDAATALEAMAARHEPVDRHPDLHWLHPLEDKETISIDQVREVIEAFSLTAHHGAGKVILIEPAEALTTAAANALLKTLEEPTSQGYLLLVSHQPGRLPATVRSRCQHLVLQAPDTNAVAKWLSVSPADVAAARRWVGPAPLRLAAALADKKTSIFNKLESELIEVSQDRLDPQIVAQAWAKGDTQVALNWLRRQLHEVLRLRLATAGGSTDVTVPGAATLHNAWRALPVRTLFDEYERAEKLLNAQGSGLNVELALVAMLNAFIVNRGRS